MNNVAFNYFYGNESEFFQFVQVPKMLLKDSRFKKLSSDAKILYALMLDRMGLSQKNNWKDEQNRIYIHYSITSIENDLNCSRPTAVKIASELTSFGLIQRATTSGKSTRFYVMNFVTCVESLPKPVKKIDQSKKLTSKESSPVPVKNFYSNNTDTNNTDKERFIESADDTNKPSAAELVTPYSSARENIEPMDLEPLSSQMEPIEDYFNRVEQVRLIHESSVIPSEVRESEKYDPVKIMNVAKAKNGNQYKNDELQDIIGTASMRYKKQAEADVIGNPWAYYLSVVKSVASQWESIKRNRRKQLDKLKSKKNKNAFHNFHQRDYDYEQLEKDLLLAQW